MMKIVKVHWRDSFTCVGWADEPCGTADIESVGWLIHKNKQRVVLAGMVGSGEYNNQQAIPRGCIVSIKELAE